MRVNIADTQQDAWDSFIQGPNMDTSTNFFPMDTSGMTPMQSDVGVLPQMGQAMAQAPQQPQGSRSNAFGQSVVMKVGTFKALERKFC